MATSGMEVSSRGSKTTEFHVSRKWKGRDQQTSPERTKVWIEPNKNKSAGSSSERKVAVIYYLSRNGQLEQPHFMDVPLSSPEGLYLRDVINRLNVLRGKGMASLYSWSSKRSYKNGFVWHDLSEDDFIYPAHGQEYILKGSELLDRSSINSNPAETASSSSFRAPKLAEESSDFPAITRRRNQSWSSIDLNEYKVYKTEPNSESFRRLAADASTQTDDKRRRRRPVKVEVEDKSQESYENQSTELGRGEISPPPSDSSPETLESLMKADGRLILCSTNGNDDNLNRTGESYPSGRMKASTVLMQLISCGAISFKDCGPSHVKDDGFSVIGHYKGRLPRGTGDRKETGTEKEICNFPRVRLEDKEYFSGSLIETNKKEDIPPALKRSNSYNADRRSSQLQLAEKEIEGVRAKCIPRKPKGLPTKREITIEGNGASCSDTQQLNMGTKDSKSNN
ncbi:protein SOSEKI 5-like isoform X1 [Mangifera indica]|uniref:protein SOSEKI 5-like isoform X1 n=1 Tax=Mangifera indica TaxID=29780 RepID=UPI001CFB16FF|nr:protein SOSEKI 5-like isoform X1 [Mangifera indica]